MPPSIEKFSNKTNSIRLIPSLTTVILDYIYYAGRLLILILLEFRIDNIYINIYTLSFLHQSIRKNTNKIKIIGIFLELSSWQLSLSHYNSNEDSS